jgi:quinol monooxygenase YgiN
MFIAVYEFEIKPGTDDEFREAWLEVTKAIYKYCGSFGSRLHTSTAPNIFVGYAQWPSRAAWETDYSLPDPTYLLFRQKMRDCLLHTKTVYELEVSDDYLQPFSSHT